MKSSSLPLLGLLTALLLLTSACKKAPEPLADAVITGQDQRYCACCGGLMINFTGETRPYTGDFKLIDNSADVGISPTEVFPLYVKVDYVDLTKCGGNSIKVTKLVRK